MKTRQGFVSNSSSSSFICDISGSVESGYDASMEDYGYVQCKKGHTMKDQYVRNLYQIFDEHGNDMRYELDPSFCPICNGQAKPEIVERLKSEMEYLNITVEDLK
jgi:hypothetical protein